ncbi:uncharacterized protein EAF02_001399 [Botrytis sinoallii]|uniref:uncharacterized protein n=1 Tax=Botrytis sinoallii TaxID=1463999 RepID=UPI0019026470|nr:uncharacterized protein EAF02_001399 [Botrytis sinoallii]KAF7891074.1 hypothetical protein EAF02_001399 [Botrytis sinoallii]
MSRRTHSKDEDRHRGRDEASHRRHHHHHGSRRPSHREAPQGSPSTTQARGGDERSQGRSPRGEASQNSGFATQPYDAGGENRAETPESVSLSRPFGQPFGPTAGMADMNILNSTFTPIVAPTRDTSLSTVPPARPNSMRDKEHCGNCDNYAEIPVQTWKYYHLEENEKCRTAYRDGTCHNERSDFQIEAERLSDQAFGESITPGALKDSMKPAQTHAPQTTSASAWSQGASQPSIYPQIDNPTYSNLQSNNPSTLYNPSASYPATGQTSNTGYGPSHNTLQPASYHSGNSRYMAPSYMLPPPVPYYSSYPAPRIPTGLSPPGCTPATGYPPPQIHYTSSNIPYTYNTQQQAPYQPATSNPPQGEQHAPTVSSAQQSGSHRGSGGHIHSHGHGQRSGHRSSSSRTPRSKE